MSLPAADDLFRPTAKPAPAESEPAETGQAAAADGEPTAASSQPQEEVPARAQRGHGRSQRSSRGASRDASGARAPSGRVRHDEKMTVYVTAEELLDLEHARLALRRAHGLAVDRGRLVREAVAIALADLDANGEDSVLVQRLMQA